MDLEVKRRSVTKNDVGDASNGGVWHWMLTPQYGNPPGNLPAYWSPTRDAYLRSLLYEPFHDFWVGAIGIATTKMASLGFTVDGETPILRKRYQELLIDFFDRDLARHLQDYLTTDNGAAIEIVRATKGVGARILGLVHLDSARITRTGEPQIPALYRDTKNQVHELKAHQVLLFADLPSPTETYYGVGLCAASRAWGAIKKLEAIERFIYEKIAGVRPKAIDLVGGVSETQLRQAVESVQEDMQARGYVQYLGAAMVPTLSDIAITHTRINLAELPDGFDYDKQFQNCVLLFANAIGLDIQDLQPLSGAPLGTATQSQVLDAKSRGKGLSSWRQQFTHAMNQFVMASTVTFAFSENDNRETQERANIASTFVSAVTALVGSGILTKEQGAQILADEHIIPDEFVPEDTTPNESLADDEQADAEDGDDSEAAETPTEEETPSEETPQASTEKAIANITRRFHADVRNLATLGFISDKSILGEMRGIVRKAVKDSYIEGLKQGGVEPDEMDNEDVDNIASLIEEQTDHVTNFVADIRAAKSDKAKQRAILDRVELWTASIDAAGQTGLSSALKNEMVVFGGEDGDESCDDCQRFKSEAHRRKWFVARNFIPGKPGASMQCKGFKCLHTFKARK